MAGRAGTVRFGVNKDIHPGQTDDDGNSFLQTPFNPDGRWTETHFSYNPGTESRDSGTTRGGDPQQSYTHVKRQTDYMSNHDGYIGGDFHLMSLDERKALNNTIYSTYCEYAGDSPNGGAPSTTTGAFD